MKPPLHAVVAVALAVVLWSASTLTVSFERSTGPAEVVYEIGEQY